MTLVLLILSRPRRRRWVLAVHPRSFQTLVIRRFQRAAGVAAGPAGDLVRPAALVAAAFPISRPALVRRHRLAAFLVPGKRHAAAIALYAHGDRREGGGAKFRRAQRLAVAATDALQEVLPQGLRAGALVDAAAVERHALLLLPALRRTVGSALRTHFVAVVGGVLTIALHLAARELDRRQPAADAVLDRIIVDHRAGDDELATFLEISDDGGDIGHVAAVVFEVDAAAADDAGWITDTHRFHDARGAVHEQIGVQAAAEVPVAAPLGEDGTVERHARRQRRAGHDGELMAQEHIPVDRLRVHVAGQRIVTPLTAEAVAIVARLRLTHVADLARFDHVADLRQNRVGGPLHADRHDRVVAPGGIDDEVRFLDRFGHRLFAIDLFAGIGGVDRHLGVPVIRRRDARDIHIALIEDAAIVLRDMIPILEIEVAAPSRRIEAAT